MKQLFLTLLAVSFATLASFLFGNGVFRASPPAPAYAQELSDELSCQEKEIPVGEVTVQVGKLVRQVGNALHSMRTDQHLQKTAVEELLLLPDQCSVNQCSSACTPQVVGIECEGKVDDKGKCLGEEVEIYECQVSACMGNPCPTAAIRARVEKIVALHDNIVRANENIASPLQGDIPSPFVTEEYCSSDQCIEDYGLLGCQNKCQQRTWREHILFNLEEARNGLQTCVTPANFYDTGYSDQEVDTLLSCQEARLNGVLSEKQAQCFNNNFFCCTIRPVQ